MKIQTQLVAIALAGMSASCGTVSDTQNNSSPSVAINTPEVRAEAQAVGDVPVRVSAPDGVNEVGSTAAPAPAGEVAPTASSDLSSNEGADAPPVIAGGAVTVIGGRFVGDLVVDKARSKVTGAGPGVTVIFGNLIVGDGCSVVGMTVTGDVIFRGNNSSAYVDFHGQVLDYGLQNRH